MVELTTQLVTESDTAQERIHLLLTAIVAVNQSLDPQEIADTALQLALDTVDMDVGTILLFQNEQRIVLASQGFSPVWMQTFQSSEFDFEDTFIGRVLDTGAPEVVPDVEQLADDRVVYHCQQVQLQSLICLPLQIPGSPPGIMLLGDAQPRSFQAIDISFLNAIVSQMSTGLRNAWLHARSQRQLKELKSVTETAQAIVSSLDFDQILDHIMEEVITQLNVEATALLLVDTVRSELEVVAIAGTHSASFKGRRLSMNQGAVGWVVQHNAPLLVPDVSHDSRFTLRDKESSKRTVHSLLCVPLRVRDQLLGVIEATNKKQSQFSHADQRFLALLGTFAAVAIENARFYEEALKQIEQTTIYARDLNATYRQERQQRTALEKLRYSFLNVIGHELKTPLAVILQGVEAFKNPRSGSLNDQQRKIVDRLDSQSRHLQQLIGGLVTFATFSARQGTVKRKEVPFAEVLDQVLMLAQFKVRAKKITLDDLRPPTLPIFLVDKDQLAEAIFHLVDNALKFSPEKSRVVMQTEVIADELLLHVVDWGTGIPTEQLHAIWDGFSQMNTSMERGLEGLGLGLAIARYIVEAHDGAITVESEFGKGSAFTIRLPLQAKAFE